MPKTRLDVVMTERGLAESRAQAQRLVMAGEVRVDGQVALKPSQAVAADAQVTVEVPPRYVSRGGEKLQAALERFHITSKGKACADVGASTGGFTDCLLQGGARRVYAIDVGEGILHWKLRQDPRVVVMEGTNARYLNQLPEVVSLVTIDASFISLKLLLPVVREWFNSGGVLVALIKPQFEAGRKQAAKADGVIRDASIHRQVLLDVLTYAGETGYGVRGVMRSPLLGPKGNVEFLAWMALPAGQVGDIEAMIDELFAANEEESG